MLRFPFLLLLLAATSLAVPANDNFVARIALGSPASVTTSGSNVGATLQTGENNLDSIGGASVWWKWIAPATTWVTVDTVGSEIDTVLAVLADGPALKDTFIVGFNDESGAPNAPFGSSRVIFRATAGTEYHLVVHGFLGAQGNVTLNITADVVPPIRINSLTLTPASVNVTTAAQNITADVGIECDASFAEGVLVVHKASFTGSLEIPLLPANRLSGTATSGVYRVTIPISRFSSPGTWFLEVAVSDTIGGQAVFGRGVSAIFEYDHVLLDGLPGIFSVANTGAVDNVKPALVSFALNPLAVNVSSVPSPMTFTFRITDTLSGFGNATLTLFTPAGDALTTVPVTAASRISGTGLDGTYSVTFTFPARMPSGGWFATLLIRDATGNPSLYDGGVNGLAFPQGAASAQWTVSGATHSYWAWMYPRITTTPGAQPGQDFDGDGLGNLQEFAFGLSPVFNDSAEANLPTVTVAGGTASLTYLRRTAGSLSGLTYTAQFGSTLAPSWLDASGGVVTPVDNFFESVTVTDPAPGGAARFGRVKVVLPP